MTDQTSTFWNRYQRKVGGAVAILGFGVFLYWVTGVALTRRAISKSEDLLKQGLFAVAADTLDARRHKVVKMQRGCAVITAAYHYTQNVQKLEWASQACLYHGNDIAEVQLGFASVAEMRGNDKAAFAILQEAAPKFDTFPDFYLRMAQIAQRNKDSVSALSSMMRAVQRSTDNGMVIDALKLAMNLGKWPEAKILAERIKDLPSEDPELKLAVAKSIKNGGDPSAAATLVQQAKQLLDLKPSLKPKLEKEYGDLLGLSNHAPQAPAAERAAISGAGAAPVSPVMQQRVQPAQKRVPAAAPRAGQQIKR